MKKSTCILTVYLLLIVYPMLLFSQNPCSGSFTEYILNSNHIRASFFPRGNKFTDGQKAAFLVPYPSSEPLSTIYASSIWIAGFDDAGNYKLAAETYPASNTEDFSVGPLTTIGATYDTLCGKFDRAWSVYREDIQHHTTDYWEDGVIDDTIPSIFGWPASGNKFFAHFNGFELPDNGNVGWASFFDTNGNNKYDPDQGDYPIVYFQEDQFVPDEILWMVFNDVDFGGPSGNKPLRFEIQLTAFAFHCQDNEILNNTIFNSYKIINRAVSVTDSVFFGTWTDYDLGCSADDYLGSDSIRNTEFVYNADVEDGDYINDCSTGAAIYTGVPPVQSMTYLSQPMHSFIGYQQESTDPLDKYHILNGVWGDGHVMRPEGDGFNTTTNLAPTKFLFNGDPRDTASWSAINALNKGTDVKSVSSVYLGRLDPGDIREVEMAYMFHHDPKGGHLDQITKMYSDVDSLLTMQYKLEQSCTPYALCLDDDCVWPGDFNHDGIVSPYDVLYWGVMKDRLGGQRNGLISWRGHYAEEWSDSFPNGVNYKHGDGNGDGQINFDDLDIYGLNYDQSNRFYIKGDQYIPGDDLIISADDIDSTGR
ncbi:MAG: hypothetical protein ABJB16_04795, partial [Saprospiraceae bacterium]